MAAGEWHPFVGPADFFIPDDPKEAIYSAAGSAGMAVGTYVAHQIAIPREMARMAAHHQVGTRAAMRATASRQLGRWTVQRGAGVFLSVVPVVGWAVLALSIAYSIPPDPRGPSGLTGYQEYQAEMASKFYMPQ